MAWPSYTKAASTDDAVTAPLLPTPTVASEIHESRHSPSTLRNAVVSVALTAALVSFFCLSSSAGTAGHGHGRSSHWPTDVGYPGPTPTGSEAFAAATSYPSNFDSYPLAPPPRAPHAPFNILYHLGNLSPWRSVNHGVASTGEVPSGCELEQIHLLHRHGARYPTSDAGPPVFANKVAEGRAIGFKATGPLEFLNEWTYQLGSEILTPFGREQLFSLGVGFRVKYGKLLRENTHKPVFRTESQDRMLKSALNFAAGFFGIPFEDQYHQLITIEAPNFNNTLSPYMTCPNGARSDLNVAPTKVAEWISIYLADALPRIQKDVDGLVLTLRDVYRMQEMCAYELVALGGSAFCPLFTETEWEGFEYALDLSFWYTFSFGHPAQAAMGLGWTQEWLARVTKEPITVFNSSTNATYHTPRYFPLDQKVYVDATHDTIVSAVLTTLGFNSFASTGPLPSTHIPASRSFDTSKISPFAANLQSQILSCRSTGDGARERKVRWILNDGVVPLDGVAGCGESQEGWCDLDTFLGVTRERAASIDWDYDCNAPYVLGDKPIVDGRPHRE